MTRMDPPEGMMTDAQGRFVPVDLVKPQHRLEDEMVNRLIWTARTANQMLCDLKVEALAEAAAFRDLLAQEYGTERGGKKGNLSFKSYDGTIVMEVAVQDAIDLGPEIATAKELIDGCLERWSADANQNLKALIDDAFQVGKAGRIDTQRVLSLRRLDIEDADWSRAMDAISDAVRVHTTRTYVRFYEVDPMTGTRKPILLDFAKV